MALFVDFVGLNTIVSSTFVTGANADNILSSSRTQIIGDLPKHKELAGININRNGPYGYPTWKQLRVSQNPITRHHVANSIMTFDTAWTIKKYITNW